MSKISRLFICEMDRASTWSASDQAHIVNILNDDDYVLLYHTGRDNPKTNGSINIVNRIIEKERGEIINVMDVTHEGVSQNISNQIMRFHNKEMDVYFIQDMRDYMKEVLAKTNAGYYKTIQESNSLRIGASGRKKKEPSQKENTKEQYAQTDNNIEEIKEKRDPSQKNEVNSTTVNTDSEKENNGQKKTKNKEPIDMGNNPFANIPDFTSREQFDKSKQKDKEKQDKTEKQQKQESQDKEKKDTEEEKETQQGKNPGTSFGIDNNGAEWDAASKQSKKKSESPTFDELERIIFNARKSGAYEERTYTDLENAKAKTVALLEERLKQNINTLIPLFAALNPSDRDYIRMVSLLSFATTFENFCESWESMEPSFKLQGFKKEIYNALREEAVYYVKICDMLYSEDIWG